MPTLKNTSQNKILFNQLKIAEKFTTRAKGLLGSKNLPDDEALWIHHCNSIHTLFMNYTIDCIFVDSKMKVVSLYENVKPWRLVLPQLKASSVIEANQGAIQRLQIKIGDVLYVGH